MRQKQRVKRVVPLEIIGLDISSISYESLNEIAQVAMDFMEEELSKVLGRLCEYVATINISRNDRVDVTVDIELYSQTPIAPSVLAKIDSLIVEVLEVVRNELLRKHGVS